MAKRKSIADKIEEVKKLFKEENYEEAVKRLGKLLENHKGATSYQMAIIGDQAKFAAEKIAEKISDEGWHSHTRKS